MPAQDERMPDGESLEEAIPIQADSSAEGVPMEYAWLESRFGRRGDGFQLVNQTLGEHEGRLLDVLHIRLADGSEKRIFFDITAFFGKGFRPDSDTTS